MMTYAQALELLSLPYGANEASIKKAYRAAARKIHPDLTGKDGPQVQGRMAALSTARGVANLGPPPPLVEVNVFEVLTDLFRGRASSRQRRADHRRRNNPHNPHQRTGRRYADASSAYERHCYICNDYGAHPTCLSCGRSRGSDGFSRGHGGPESNDKADSWVRRGSNRATPPSSNERFTVKARELYLGDRRVPTRIISNAYIHTQGNEPVRAEVEFSTPQRNDFDTVRLVYVHMSRNPIDPHRQEGTLKSMEGRVRAKSSTRGRQVSWVEFGQSRDGDWIHG